MDVDDMGFINDIKSLDAIKELEDIESLNEMKPMDEVNLLGDIKSLDEIKALDESKTLDIPMEIKQELSDIKTDFLTETDQDRQQQLDQQQLEQQVVKMELDDDVKISCHQCGVTGEIENSKLIQCCTCSLHFHSTCAGVGEIIPTNWNCSECQRKCQICHQHTENEGGRTLRCEECQKLYHGSCMRPMMTSIPKFGWKCNQCRVCSDCGSRTPGAGVSSRWHCHFTVCDSCYQQRNKGFSCPICQRAYRAAAHKEMVKCSSCNRFVHSSCDEAADLQQYHTRKENNPDYDYVCPVCKALPPKVSQGKDETGDVLSAQKAMAASSSAEVGMESVKTITGDFGYVPRVGSGKPGDLYKLTKKRVGRGGKLLTSKSGGSSSHLGRKRGAPRGKGRNMLMVTDKQQNTGDRSGKESENTAGMGTTDSKYIFIDSQDEYLMWSDICVLCGSLGVGEEGVLIGCRQCGQCFHPYCANIKMSKTVLERGWRCLDCTICEGCGEKNDEARLILCDECDISYHIYCIDPPLDSVPQGAWKCHWCAYCQVCDRTNPGKNSEWMNGYTECGPCASELNCCVCSQAYVENDLMLECVNCERWLHGKCDNINSGEEAEEKTEDGDYTCPLCRRLEEQEKPAQSGGQQDATGTLQKVGGNQQSSAGFSSQTEHGAKTEHWLDGVCVSEHGFQFIKSLSNEIKRKRKVQPRNANEPQQDFGIQATIESVVSAGTDNNDAAGTSQHDEAKTPATPTNFKDGMLWTAGPEVPAPEGFSILKNDAGVSILRKKRQRNLQKVGIGGFTVRNRAPKKETTVEAEGGAGASGGSSEKKKKAARPKARNKVAENFPPYLQEAFFGKDLLSTSKTTSECFVSDMDTSSDEESPLLNFGPDNIIKLEPSLDSTEQDKNSIKSEEIKIEPNLGLSEIEADADDLLNSSLVEELQQHYMQHDAEVPDFIKTETLDMQQNISTATAATFSSATSVASTSIYSGKAESLEMSLGAATAVTNAGDGVVGVVGGGNHEIPDDLLLQAGISNVANIG